MTVSHRDGPSLWASCLLIAFLGSTGVALSQSTPTYRSDSDPLYKALETLQRRQYAVVGEEPPVHDEDALFAAYLELPVARADVESAWDSFRQLLRRPIPTRYQDISSLLFIDDASTAIVAAAEEMKLTLRGPIAFGTLPIYDDLNARSISFDAGKNRRAIVLLNTSLFLIVRELNELLLRTISITPTGNGNFVEVDSSPETLTKLIEADPTLPRRFLQLLSMVVEAGRPVESFQLDGRRQNLAAAMGDAMEFFIVGHEYGHTFNADRFSGAMEYRLRDGSQSREALRTYENQYGWNAEIGADILGVRLTARALIARARSADDARYARKRYGFALHSLLLLMTYMDVVDDARIACSGPVPTEHNPEVLYLERWYEAATNRAAISSWKLTSVLANRWRSRKGHPPPVLRQQVLDEAIDRLLGTELVLEDADYYMVAALRRNVRRMWNDYATQFKASCKSGLVSQ